MKGREFRPVTLRGSTDTSDGAGGTVQAWSDIGVIWVREHRSRGLLSNSTGVGGFRSQKVFETRATGPGSPSRPKAGQRLADGARVYSVVHVDHGGPSANMLQVTVVEEVAI